MHFGLQLVRSLSTPLQSQAELSPLLRHPIIPEPHDNDLLTARWNRDDQRHLLGVFRDNRVGPDEGLCAPSLPPSQQKALLSLVSEFLLYIASRAHRGLIFRNMVLLDRRVG